MGEGRATDPAARSDRSCFGADFQDIVARGISEPLRWKGIEATERLAGSPNSKEGLPIILDTK